MYLEDFVRYYNSNAPQLMWFLGAGASRTAGIITAGDIVDDLKIKLYCTENDLDVSEFKLLTEPLREKINAFFSSKSGYPKPNSMEEYSFYLETFFKGEKAAERKYFEKIIAKGNPSIGNKIFASMITIGLIKAIFTTNFDDIIEKSLIFLEKDSLKNIYHLEGAKNAINAVDDENFPLYIKIHGDYRYDSIKNLSEELKSQNNSLMKAFFKLSLRYGIIFTGYSGRDKSVIDELSKIVEEKNAFSKGIFWLTPKSEFLPTEVHDFIRKANQKGINANIISGAAAGNFDVLMRKIWDTIEEKPQDLLRKIKITQTDNILPFEPKHGNTFPVLRTNVFKIVSIPLKMMSVECPEIKTTEDFYLKFKGKGYNLITSREKKILFWGDPLEFEKIKLKKQNFKEVDISSDTHAKLYFRRMLLEAIILAVKKGKALLVKKIGSEYFITINPQKTNDISLKPLNKFLPSLKGRQCQDEYYESLRVRLEYLGGNFYFLIKPSIWIEPVKSRITQQHFLRRELKKRSNILYNKYLEAWTQILFSNVTTSRDGICSLLAFTIGSENNPEICIIPKNCYSKLL